MGLSLRDRDEGTEDIEDIPPLRRFKTSCRAVENLILSDESLIILGTTWQQLEINIEKWLATFEHHSKYAYMQAFKEGGYNRKAFNLKEVRNILIGLTGFTKPWEIAVGQAISKIVNGQSPKDFSENKLCNYLGKKFSNLIFV